MVGIIAFCFCSVFCILITNTFQAGGVAFEHSRVPANFCGTGFTSDRPCTMYELHTFNKSRVFCLDIHQKGGEIYLFLTQFANAK